MPSISRRTNALDISMVVLVDGKMGHLVLHRETNLSRIPAADENFGLDTALLDVEDSSEKNFPIGFLDLIETIKNNVCWPKTIEDRVQNLPHEVLVAK